MQSKIGVFTDLCTHVSDSENLKVTYAVNPDLFTHANK